MSDDKIKKKQTFYNFLQIIIIQNLSSMKTSSFFKRGVEEGRRGKRGEGGGGRAQLLNILVKIINFYIF